MVKTFYMDRTEMVIINHVENFYKNFPQFEWDYGSKGISSNPSVTPEFLDYLIECGIELCWGLNGLSSNPSITPEFIKKHLYTPLKFGQEWWWESGGLSLNPAVTPEFIEKHLDIPTKFDQDWWWGSGGISSNISITPEFLLKHLDTPQKYHQNWDFGQDGLSCNPAIHPMWIHKHKNLPLKYNQKWRMDWRGVSLNPSITLEFINIYAKENEGKYKDNPDALCWGIGGLSSNPSLTPLIIEAYPNKNWYWMWNGITSCPNLTTEFLKKNLDKKIKWPTLSKNLCITKEMIDIFIDNSWNWGILDWIALVPYKTSKDSFYPFILNEHFNPSGISTNPSVTTSVLEKYLIFHNFKDYQWVIGKSGLSKNSGLVPRMIDLIQEKDPLVYNSLYWGKDGISSNPSITIDFVENHIDVPCKNNEVWNLSNNIFSIPRIVHNRKLKIAYELIIWKGWGWIYGDYNPASILSNIPKELIEIILDSVVM